MNLQINDFHNFPVVKSLYKTIESFDQKDLSSNLIERSPAEQKDSEPELKLQLSNFY